MQTLKQLNEVSTRVALYEEIEQMNDTGYLTEDLVSIVETAQKNVWSEGLTSDDFDAHLEKLRKEAMDGK